MKPFYPFDEDLKPFDDIKLRAMGDRDQIGEGHQVYELIDVLSHSYLVQSLRGNLVVIFVAYSILDPIELPVQMEI